MNAKGQEKGAETRTSGACVRCNQPKLRHMLNPPPEPDMWVFLTHVLPDGAWLCPKFVPPKVRA
jgi:hypothetical protein